MALIRDFSSAFATILMDYRPDGRPIRVENKERNMEYRGRFLGSILKTKSKTLGGVLLAPGSIVPEGGAIFSKKELLQRGDSAS